MRSIYLGDEKVLWALKGRDGKVQSSGLIWGGGIWRNASKAAVTR